VDVQVQTQRGQDAREHIQPDGRLAVLDAVHGAHGNVGDQRKRPLVQSLAATFFSYLSPYSLRNGFIA